MSNIKISELPQAQPITGDEQVPIVQDGETVRTTARTLVSSSVVDISQSIIVDAGSTTKVPSVNATKTYVDGLVLGLVDDRGNFTPSPSLPGGFPTLNGSGAGGQIMKGDLWFIDAIGYINSVAVTVGQSIRALQDNPLQDPTKWNILSAGLIQSTLQNVLTAGNTADNQSITLYDTGHTMSSRVRYDENLMSSTSGATLATDADKLRAYNSNTTNIVEANNASDPYVKVYRGSTNKYTSLFSDSLKYSNSGFLGRLSSSNLTASQTWTLPDATGTIALANNIWNATGNSGTIAGANFLGTIDTVDLVIKTNNLERIRVANTGGVTISDLAGTGTRTVVASSTGQLSTTISSSGWSTLGNASTSPLTNFIGTTDANDLVFKVNNTERLRIDSVYGEVKTTGQFRAEGSGDTLIMAASTIGNGTAALAQDSINKGYIFLGNGVTNVQIQCNNITSARVLQVPDASGTIALTSDIISPTLQVVTSGTNRNLINGVNYQGTLAGDGVFSGQNINAFGSSASKDNFGSNLNALGYHAAQNNGGIYVNALGYQAAKGNLGADTNAFGTNAALSNQGQYVNAIGNQAAGYNLANHVNAIGQQAAYQNESQYVNAMGFEAGYSNGHLATNLNALGHGAAYGNQGENVNAMGQAAAFQNTGSAINAFGDQAAWRNGYPGFTTYEVNAFGTMAAKENESHDVNFIGYQAGMSNSGAIVNGFGKNAAGGNSGGEVNAMGFEAAYANTGSYVNAFGNSAASGNSGSNINAFGTNAGNANSLSGMTIFSNNCMPSYTNYAAAAAAITVLLGASSGCTYLYHDQATNSIGAVRL